MIILDAHIHSWDPEISPDILVFDRFPSLHRPMEAGQAAQELGRLGIAGAVLVQSEPSPAHNDYCLAQMQQNSFVRAATGWLDPTGNHTETGLAQFASRFAATRVMLNRMDLPPGSEAPLARFCDRLGRHGITVELLAHQQHLGLVSHLAQAAPDTRFILNHSGQPDTSAAAEKGWAGHMDHLGRLPNMFNKVSGLLEKSGGSVAGVVSHLNVIFQSFAPAKLMFASNWPMTDLFGGTLLWTTMLEDSLPAAWSEHDRSCLWAETCIAAYGCRGVESPAA